ncbi:hypothetical protein A2U01_0067787 [Trifolium medium]|uniref:Uncharacterized protein n=1 Tax=Trifolium medium TaxID=97028 RepID=A0A392SDQ3_9FABA|nr:hypothetical protein [Trifolium medium]
MKFYHKKREILNLRPQTGSDEVAFEAEDEPVVIPQLKRLPPINPVPVVTVKAEPVFISRTTPDEVIDLGDDVVIFLVRYQ